MLWNENEYFFASAKKVLKDLCDFIGVNMQTPKWFVLYKSGIFTAQGLKDINLDELYQGNTALGYFILENDIEMVKYLCETLNVDPNEPCHFTVAGVALPALFWSRFWMNEGIVQILLDNGADLKATENMVVVESISNLLQLPCQNLFKEYNASREKRLESSVAILWLGKNIFGEVHEDLFLRDICVTVSKYLANTMTDWTLKRY